MGHAAPGRRRVAVGASLAVALLGAANPDGADGATPPAIPASAVAVGGAAAPSAASATGSVAAPSRVAPSPSAGAVPPPPFVDGPGRLSMAARSGAPSPAFPGCIALGASAAQRIRLDVEVAAPGRDVVVWGGGDVPVHQACRMRCCLDVPVGRYRFEVPETPDAQGGSASARIDASSKVRVQPRGWGRRTAGWVMLGLGAPLGGAGVAGMVAAERESSTGESSPAVVLLVAAAAAGITLTALGAARLDGEPALRVEPLERRDRMAEYPAPHGIDPKRGAAPQWAAPPPWAPEGPLAVEIVAEPDTEITVVDPDDDGDVRARCRSPCRVGLARGRHRVKLAATEHTLASDRVVDVQRPVAFRIEAESRAQRAWGLGLMGGGLVALGAGGALAAHLDDRRDTPLRHIGPTLILLGLGASITGVSLWGGSLAADVSPPR